MTLSSGESFDLFLSFRPGVADTLSGGMKVTADTTVAHVGSLPYSSKTGRARQR